MTNRYRFVRFRAEITVRVPYDEGENPIAVYEAARERFLQVADFDQAHGWDMRLLNTPKTKEYDSN